MGSNVSSSLTTPDCFLEACFNGELQVISNLICEGIDINVKDADGNNGLYYAIAGNKPQVLKLLIDARVDFNAINNEKHTCLHIASIALSLECVKVLLNINCNANLLDCNELTPLMNVIAMKSSDGSIKYKQEKIIRKLLNCESLDFYLKGKEGLNTLHFAVLFGNEFIVEKLLTNHPAIVSTSNNDGNQAIHFAVLNNNVRILKMLLQKGANVNAVNDFGLSALHIAVQKASVECIEILLKHNCDVNIQDEYGMTPLMIAMGNMETCDDILRLKRQKVINLLTQLPNISFNIRSERGLNCLHIASMFGNNFAVKTILMKYPELSCVTDNSGNQAIHFAALKGRKDTVESLLNANKISINIKGCDSWTPLHFAVANSHYSCIEFLVSNDADCDAYNNSLETCLHLAVKKFIICRRQHENGCKFDNIIRDSKPIDDIFQKLPHIKSDKCALFAIIIYLLRIGDADSSIKDKDGNTAFDLITDDIVDSVDVNKYITTHYSDCDSNEMSTRDYVNYMKSRSNDLKDLLSRKYDECLRQKDEEIKQLALLLQKKEIEIAYLKAKISK